MLYIGDDYEGVFQKSVKFDDGLNDSTTFEIIILDDDLAEGVETFYGELEVHSPTQNFSIMINIEILDDEGNSDLHNSGNV